MPTLFPEPEQPKPPDHFAAVGKMLPRDETNWLRPYQSIEKRKIQAEVARLDRNPPQDFPSQQYHADLGAELALRESKQAHEASKFQAKKKIGQPVHRI